MKKLIIATALLALLSAGVRADVEEVEGPTDSRGVIMLAGEPDQDQEPAPDPAINGTHEQYCADARIIGEAVTRLRDQGAPVEYPINHMVEQKQQQFIWIARQAYWPQSAGSDPATVGFDVWLRCKREKMTYSK